MSAQTVRMSKAVRKLRPGIGQGLVFEGEVIHQGQTAHLVTIEGTRIYDHKDQKVWRGVDKTGEYFLLDTELFEPEPMG